VITGNSTGTNSGGNAFEQFMSLLAAKTAKDLALDISVTQPSAAK
jgi:hypothetical protein